MTQDERIKLQRLISNVERSVYLATSSAKMGMTRSHTKSGQKDLARSLRNENRCYEKLREIRAIVLNIQE